jgi:hypothetical protein
MFNVSPGFVFFFLTPMLGLLILICVLLIKMYEIYKFDKWVRSFHEGNEVINLTQEQSIAILDSPTSAYSKIKVIKKLSQNAEDN